MSIESATYISQLNSSLPASSDPRSEGDDHLKLIKAVLKATFPNISGAVTTSHTALNAAFGVSTSGQWSLMRTVTVSGSPSAVDFVDGSGGVEISSNYDAYLLEFTDIKCTSGAGTLRLQISENAGVTFPANATGCGWESDYISSGSTLTRGTGQAFLTLANVGVMATDPAFSGRVLIFRPLSGRLENPVRAELFGYLPAAPLMVNTAGVMASTTNQFNALRLTLSASTFAGSNARVKFFGRRA